MAYMEKCPNCGETMYNYHCNRCGEESDPPKTVDEERREELMEGLN